MRTISIVAMSICLFGLSGMVFTSHAKEHVQICSNKECPCGCQNGGECNCNCKKNCNCGNGMQCSACKLNK